MVNRSTAWFGPKPRRATSPALLIALVAGTAFAGCAASLADNPSERCGGNLECAPGRTCVRSFCVDDDTTRSDASLDLATSDLGDTPVDLGMDAGTDLGVVAPSDLGVVTTSDLGVTKTDLGVVAPTDLGVVVKEDLGVMTVADLGVDAGAPVSCRGRDTRCGAFCVDLNDSFLNCGSCGRECSPTDRRCHRGECDP